MSSTMFETKRKADVGADNGSGLGNGNPGKTIFNIAQNSENTSGAERCETDRNRGFMLSDCERSGITEEQAARLGFTPAMNGYEIPYRDPATREPMTTPDGKPFCRKRLRSPGRDGCKYIQPPNSGIRCYILPEVHETLATDPSLPLYITEGEKKAAKAALEGLPVVGIGGIWNWIQEGGSRDLNADLVPYVANGREVVMIYDSDASENHNKRIQFKKCATGLAQALEEHGSKLYRFDLPKLDGGKTGLDDWFQAGKSLAELKRLIDEQRQPVEPPMRETVDLDGEWMDIIGAVAKAVGPSREIFFHGGEMVRLATESGCAQFQPLKPVEACSELERFCRFEKEGKKRGEGSDPSVGGFGPTYRRGSGVRAANARHRTAGRLSDPGLAGRRGAAHAAGL